MAVAQIQKVALLIAKDRIREVLVALQARGIFAITENKDATFASMPADWHHSEARLAEMNFVIDYLQDFAPAPQGFRAKMLGNKVESTEQQAELALTQDYTSVIEQSNSLAETEARFKNEKSALIEKKAILTQWKSLNTTLDFDRETASTTTLLGTVENEYAEELKKAFADHDLAEVESIYTGETLTSVLVVFHKSLHENVHVILDQVRFSETDLATSNQTPEQAMASAETRIAAIETEQQAIITSKSALAAENLQNLKLAHDALHWQQLKKIALKNATETESTVMLEGFVPAAQRAELETLVAQTTPEAAVIDLEAGSESETKPTLLENNAFTRPFAAVTGFFGLPKKAEVDPTPFIAPFFAIFFGFCLTDAGYGFLIFATFLFLWKFFPAGRDLRSIFMLLTICGFSTIVMGVLFGGYFGLTPDQLSFMQNPATGFFYGQVFDPVNDLVPKIMLLAYAMGVIQLLLGVVLSGVNNYRNDDKIKIATVTVPMFAAVIIGLLWVAADQGLIDAALQTPLLYTLYALVAILIWGLGSGNIFLRPVIGVLMLANEAISWLANVLSYSRLFALGLATGIIALSFNQIAVMAGGSLHPLIGIPVIILVALLGHSLNFGLNFIGALVHTARLQFVEFFGSFYEGGGKPFEPLKRETKYLFDARK